MIYTSLKHPMVLGVNIHTSISLENRILFLTHYTHTYIDISMQKRRRGYAFPHFLHAPKRLSPKYYFYYQSKTYVTLFPAFFSTMTALNQLKVCKNFWQLLFYLIVLQRLFPPHNVLAYRTCIFEILPKEKKSITY